MVNPFFCPGHDHLIGTVRKKISPRTHLAHGASIQREAIRHGGQENQSPGAPRSIPTALTPAPAAAFAPPAWICPDPAIATGTAPTAADPGVTSTVPVLISVIPVIAGAGCRGDFDIGRRRVGRGNRDQRDVDPDHHAGLCGSDGARRRQRRGGGEQRKRFHRIEPFIGCLNLKATTGTIADRIRGRTTANGLDQSIGVNFCQYVTANYPIDAAKGSIEEEVFFL